jgi:hypothetical protein
MDCAIKKLVPDVLSNGIQLLKEMRFHFTAWRLVRESYICVPV